VRTNVHVLPSRGSAGDEFGVSLCLADNLLAVGSRYSSFSFDKSGAAYIYERDDASLDWLETAILTALQPIGIRNPIIQIV
jgi:hypothetical protein